MAGLKVVIAEGREGVEFTPTEAPEGQSDTWSLRLSTEQLDSLLLHLIDLRATMQPPHEGANPAKGTLVRTHPGMQWLLARKEDGLLQLGLMHPGLGWLGMLLNEDDSRRFANFLPDEPEPTAT